MRLDEKPPYQQRDTWWSLYGRVVRWFSVMYGFVILPLVVMFFVDPDMAWVKFRELVFGLGIIVPALGLMLWFTRDQDTTIDKLTESRDAGKRQTRSKHSVT